MSDSNWKWTENGPAPKTPEHALVWHIYESVLVYTLVIGFGLFACIDMRGESWTAMAGVVSAFLCLLAFCIWADLKKRKQLRFSIDARLSRSFAAGETSPPLCSEALRVLGYQAHSPEIQGRAAKLD